MAYLLIFISVSYLFLQKYFHLNVPLKGITQINFIGIFYFSILIIAVILFVFNGCHKLRKKGKLPKYLKTLGGINILSIILAELLRSLKPEMLHTIYFNGYPIDKILIAGFYSVILCSVIFQLFVIFFTLLGYKAKVLRGVVSEGILIAAMLIGAFFVSSNYHEDLSVYTGEREYDFAVILGAAVVKKNKPSAMLKGRIAKGIELYRRGLATKIICTGGNAPGEIPEAEAEKRMLIEHEIPERDILYEGKTSTTLEQILYLKNLNVQQKKFMIVSDAFHLARINDMCKFMGVQGVPVASGLKISSGKLFYYKLRESVALLLFRLFGI